MKFTAPANSAKMEERPRFYSVGTGAGALSVPIGTHLFLLIAELRDGATVNMTDGCATMESERAVRTNGPRTNPKNLPTRGDAERCDGSI